MLLHKQHFSSTKNDVSLSQKIIIHSSNRSPIPPAQFFFRLRLSWVGFLVFEGSDVGLKEGLEEGLWVDGFFVGFFDGALVGLSEGASVGASEGFCVGLLVFFFSWRRSEEGFFVGLVVGWRSSGLVGEEESRLAGGWVG